MVSLEQIQDLEVKVQNTVAYITKLKQENSLLQKNLEKYRKRIDELEVLINEYKEDQTAIEEGIKNALLHLDKLEDSIAKPPVAGKAPVAAVRADEAPVKTSAASAPIEVDDIEGVPVDASEAEEDDDAGEEAEKAPGELDIF
ncbi:MAG: cell division protein ZapB [Spirochaetales bacterium]|jgi:chromosome segregation ATPase|nr:cell division protein ZapB [Spirochaetales bacterium]